MAAAASAGDEPPNGETPNGRGEVGGSGWEGCCAACALCIHKAIMDVIFRMLRL